MARTTGERKERRRRGEEGEEEMAADEEEENEGRDKMSSRRCKEVAKSNKKWRRKRKAEAELCISKQGYGTMREASSYVHWLDGK